VPKFDRETSLQSETTLANALELRYGNKYLTQVYKIQLKSRAQESSETLQEFGAEIERLIRLAYPQAPEEFLNQIAVQNFTDGVRGADLQQALRLGRFSNLTDAVVYSLEFEAAKNISYKKESVREVKFSDNQDQADSTLSLIVKKLDQILQKGDNNRRSHSPSREDIKCYNCGRKGHYSRNCRQRSRSPNPQYRRNQD